MTGLPVGWVEAPFSELTVNYDGRRIPLKASDRAARPGRFRYYGAQGVIDHIDDFLFDGTYLLVAEDGANLTSRAQPIAQIATGQFWVNNHAHVVQAIDGVSLEYLKHYLNGHSLNGVVRGTAQPKLTQAGLNGLLVRLAPTREQDRIVAAIEEQFSRLDAGIAAVKRARMALVRMRSALLARLLVDRDRRTAWPLRKLGDVVASGRYGTSTRCSYDGPGMPVLRIPNIQSGSVALEDLKFAVDERVDLTGDIVAENDILIIRTNGSRSLIGRAAVVPLPTRPLAYASYLIRLRVDEEILDPRFLVMCLASPQLRVEIERLAATSAGQYNISLRKLQALRVPVPPVDDQLAMLGEVQRQLSHIAELELETQRSLQKAARLRSAILITAFTGRLAAQDSADEPAAVLLERVVGTKAVSNSGRQSSHKGGRRARKSVTA
jgi:type I restriction enzyme S subunit